MPADGEVWFEVEFALRRGPPLGPRAIHVREVARRTGRSTPAVAMARRTGRIPAAPLPPDARRGSHPHAYVLADEADLASWRLATIEEVLTGHPELPQDARGWLTMRGLVLREGGGLAAARLIRRLNPARLTWGGDGPFRGVTRYYVPACGDHPRLSKPES